MTSSLLYVVVGLSYALPAEASKTAAPCGCSALENLNSLARNSLRKKFPQPCFSSFLLTIFCIANSLQENLRPTCSPHAKAFALLRLPRQKLDLEALLSVDSLGERLPRNFSPPAKAYANPLGFRTVASCSFSISLFCSALGSLALLFLFHLQL